jgi:hypothetical protein
MLTTQRLVGLVVIVLAALMFAVVAATTISGGFLHSISIGSAATSSPGVTYYDM